MPPSILINHTLPELTQLGLLHTKEAEPLLNAGITSTSDLLAYHHQHKDFTSIQGLSAESQRHLEHLVMELLRLKTGIFSTEHLFDDAVGDRSALFVPVAIDWSQVTGYKRDFLDTWITHRRASCTYPYVQEFLRAYLEGVQGAEAYYRAAIVNPLRADSSGVLGSGCSWFMEETNKLFLRLCQAAQLLDDPVELFRCWVWNQYRLEREGEHLRRILALYDGTSFPFAYAVQAMDLSSPYFNYRRGFQDINRMRYVSLYNDDPYTWGNLAYTGMSEKQYRAAREEAEEYATLDCRAIIACLLALGFRANYRNSSDQREDQVSMTLVNRINRLEGLFHPAQYYAFLFNELYGAQFVVGRPHIRQRYDP